MIYFAQTADNQYIKVGKADDPIKRLAGIQTSVPQRIKLLATMPGSHEQERAVHARFDYLRARGEWFRTAPELVSFALESARTLNAADFSDPKMRAFFKLALYEPKLLKLYADAAAVRDEGNTPYFCANAIFFGYHGARGFKRPLLNLVGWYADRDAHPSLLTPDAYDVAYETIYDALPDCRDCMCA